MKIHPSFDMSAFFMPATEVRDLKTGDFVRFLHGHETTIGRILAVHRGEERAVHIKSRYVSPVYTESELILRKWVHVPTPPLLSRLFL
jgi:hypothetical protein